MGTDKPATVLVLDDEEMVVKSLSFFLELETPYHVVPYTSAAAALAYLEKNPLDIVISDYLMPEMDGLTFLRKVRDLHPDAPRVLLTGYADKENAIRAINEIGLYQYIEKPWNNDDLKILLRNGIERSLLMNKLRQKAEEISRAYGDLQGLQNELLRAFA